jgi:uncharacterized protein (DUF2249 family)
MNDPVVSLDVREDIRQGREPFGRIMGAAAQLAVGQKLLLVAPFKPEPLFGVMTSRGFSYQATPLTGGDWQVLFERVNLSPVPALPEQSPCTPPRRERNFGDEAAILEVDARGLEPPQPLVLILERLADLEPDQALHARTDRKPLHLYCQLESRGFHGVTQELPDGSFLTRIERR